MDDTDYGSLKTAMEEAAASIERLASLWKSWLRVTCTVHGPMHRDDGFLWRCEGFDGEGCESRITDEEAAGLGAGTPAFPWSGVSVRNIRMEP
jgi:hypothetical protein